MKIIPVNNYRYNQISNLTKYPKQNNITFGHYLDDEMYNKQSRLATVESDIRNIDERIWSENRDFEWESSSLDSQIDSAESRLDETERRISKLRDRADSKESYIDSLSSEGYRLQQKAKKNLGTIKSLETEKQNTVKQLQESNTTLQNALAEEFKTKSKQIENEFKANAEEMQKGVKGTLIQKVINPIIDSVEGKEVELPSSIYIENLLTVPTKNESKTATSNAISQQQIDMITNDGKISIFFDKNGFKKSLPKLEILRRNFLKIIAGTELEPILKKMTASDIETLFEELAANKQLDEKSFNNIIENYFQKLISEQKETKTTDVLKFSKSDIDKLTETAEPIFSWLVKQTDSNYSKINTAEYSDKKEVFSLLKKISLLASRNYEETGRRTFTLISGFENIISSLKDNEGIKELFLNAEKMYHNIIVVISKIPYLELSPKIKFSDVVTVEKNFLKDKKIGKDSLVEFVSKHQYTGENLLSKIIKK